MLNRYDFGGSLVADKSVFNLRFDVELRKDLQAMADEQDRKLHNMIIFILRQAVEQWKLSRDTPPPS